MVALAIVPCCTLLIFSYQISYIQMVNCTCYDRKPWNAIQAKGTKVLSMDVTGSVLSSMGGVAILAPRARRSITVLTLKHATVRDRFDTSLTALRFRREYVAQACEYRTCRYGSCQHLIRRFDAQASQG